MLNISKTQVIRILLCAAASILILHTTSTVVAIEIYTIYDWQLFSLEEGFGGLEDNIGYMIISTVVYHYGIALLSLAFLWRWFGIPREFIRKDGLLKWGFIS